MFKSRKKSKAPAIIRKGIYLSALIYIEGEQAPDENFNELAKAALKDKMAGDNNPEYARLTIILKRVEEQTDVEEDEDETGNGAEKGDQFEF